MTVSENGFLWEAETVLGGSDRSESLAWALVRAGIRFVSFSPRAEQEEVSTFLKAVNWAQTSTDEYADDLAVGRSGVYSVDACVSDHLDLSVKCENMQPRRIHALLVGALLLQACAGTGGTEAQTPDAPRRMSNAELEALYRARQDSALMRVSDADVHFMTGMIGHHAQALVMAGFAPANEAGHQISTLTARIINAQKDEIALMQGWLLDREKPVPEVDDKGHMTHPMQMPGMLTAEQLEDLEKARGPEYDRLFLTYMIQHHEGAVSMVHELFATDGAAQDDVAFKLASDIQVDQITEIARMRRMLEALPTPQSNH